MSGARSNIVPMPMMTPMTTPPPAPAMWSGFPAGCCPPGGMDALMQCYCDIQAATAFISKVVTDLAANDPAFQKALVDAIAASGSNLPLIGVTNGVDAQSGQVGEFVQFVNSVGYPANTGYVASAQTITVGILQPGDWDVWFYAETSTVPGAINFRQDPTPVGFNNNLLASVGGATENWIISQMVRALISVPSLIVGTLNTDTTSGTTTAGTIQMITSCRRRR